MSDIVGFIGLGNMGFPMTRVLAGTGKHLTVFDVDDGALARAADLTGVDAAASSAEVAKEKECTTVFTCVPNDAILKSLYLGHGGLVENLSAGSITIDCSTVHPDSTREIAVAAADRGARHLDASMLGSIPQAETGDIGFVVGGDRDAFERSIPLLDILGRFVKYAGGSGSANQIKLIHQTR